MLEERLGGPTLRGAREGGLTGAAYYVLSREGADFVAVPVSQWLSFRPQRQCGNTLYLSAALLTAILYEFLCRLSRERQVCNNGLKDWCSLKGLA